MKHSATRDTTNYQSPPATGRQTETPAPRPAAGSPGGRVEPLLGVAEVMARYGLRDRRAARRVMDQAGAFLVGRRLLVAEADLLACEERLRAARRARTVPATDRPQPRARRNTPGPVNPTPLQPGWWRQAR